jgi:VanZ family protein
VEIWLQPDRARDSSTIVAFFDPARTMHFSIRQEDSDLELRRGNLNTSTRNALFTINGLLGKKRQLFITLASDTRQSSLYADGKLLETAEFAMDFRDLEQQLTVGTSPIDHDGWKGALLGLAIYRRNLVPEEIVRHYQSWTAHERPEITANDANMALYLFNERSGSIMHNLASPGRDLFAPERYLVIYKPFLETPTLDNKMDIALNIAGFTPFGYFVYAWFSGRKRRLPPVAYTILSGFALSLTIELLQFYLPVRDSDATDLITNTLGTIIGAMLCTYLPLDKLRLLLAGSVQ